VCFLVGCQTSQQKALTSAQTNLANQQASASQFSTGQAEQILPGVGNILQGLISGNLSDITSILQPQISSLSAQYAQTAASNAEFAPRGGGRTAALTEQPFTEANAVSTLVNEARGGAISEAGSLGLGELGAGTTSASTASSSLTSATEQTDVAAQQQQQAGEGLGALLAVLVGA